MLRKDLTLANRIALLDQIKSHPPNTSRRQLAKIIGVPKSTVTRLINQEPSLREEWASQEGQPPGRSRKRKREGKDPDVEEALNLWFLHATEVGVRVSGPMLKSKSVEFAKKLGHVNFKATDGWLSRWKARNDIKLKRARDEKDTAVPEQGKSSILADLLQKISEEEMYEAVVEADPLPVLERVTNEDAKKCIAMLRRYFTQEDVDGDSPVSSLDICEAFVELQSVKRSGEENYEASPDISS